MTHRTTARILDGIHDCTYPTPAFNFAKFSKAGKFVIMRNVHSKNIQKHPKNPEKTARTVYVYKFCRTVYVYKFLIEKHAVLW